MLPPATVTEGRPTALTSDRARKILIAIAAGMYRGQAALLAGVNPTMLSKWLSRDGEPYATFQNWVSEAEAHFEATMITKIAKHEDPKHAEWLLERKFPERWGKTIVVPGVSVNVNLTQMLQTIEQRAHTIVDPRGPLPGAPSIIDAMRGDDVRSLVPHDEPDDSEGDSE